MPYMHKAKWGAVDALAKKSLVVDPHMFSAPVGTIRVGDKGERELMFWRSKTRCSSNAEWMELHDAADGSCLWRAESRYCDRAAPVTTVMPNGRERTEFLTVLRLYLESETTPRLMIVHRDTQPNGLRSPSCAKSLAVYMLDPSQARKPAQAVGGDAAAAGGGPAAPGVKPADDVEQFDFAALPAGEDIFQISLNSTMTTISLAALRLPTADEMEARLAKNRGLTMSKHDVRTLARYKITHESLKRKVEIDGGLDLPLVTMLLCCVDQVRPPSSGKWEMRECEERSRRIVGVLGARDGRASGRAGASGRTGASARARASGGWMRRG